MNLARFRPVTRTVKLHDGRKVKVTISDNQRVQHVEDGDVQHATAIPAKIGVKSRFQPDANTGLWVPLNEGGR